MEKIITNGSFWFKESKEKRRRCKRYGITSMKFNEIFDKQDGCCAICGKHQSELSTKLCIDHNHNSGKVRGLLCFQCNLMLGNINENIEVLINAVKYLLS